MLLMLQKKKPKKTETSIPFGTQDLAFTCHRQMNIKEEKPPNIIIIINTTTNNNNNNNNI
jgi:hypothetical protein